MPARSVAIAACLTAFMPLQANAQADAVQVEALFDAMSLDELLIVMRDEGIEYGQQIADDLFPGKASTEWDGKVSQIYALDAMTQTIRSGLAASLEGADMDAIVGFFEGDLGQQIIALEVSARQALMDEAVEDASKEAAALALIDETPRAALVTEFVEVNDLVETNVVGAMNANYAFYVGLLDGGGVPGAMSQDDILADVWSQEPEIRQNTTEWVYSYLMLAYQPLSDEQLQDYIAFSKTNPGEDINAALFASFDAMFEEISEALGRAASQQMMAQDL